MEGSHQEGGRQPSCRNKADRRQSAQLRTAALKLRVTTTGRYAVPVQCSTIVNSGLKSVSSCARNQKSIVQSPFEYETSREFVRGNFRVMSQDLIRIQDFPPFSQYKNRCDRGSRSGGAVGKLDQGDSLPALSVHTSRWLSLTRCPFHHPMASHMFGVFGSTVTI